MKKKRTFNPIWILYTLVIFLPLGVLYTVFTAITTIILVSLRMNGDKVNSFVRFWGRFMCVIALSGVRVEGLEHIDRNKSYIFLSNHQGLYDIFAVYGYLPNRFAWIMKEELRKMPFVGKACEKVGHVFIDRSSKMRSMRSIKEAEQILKTNKRSVVIFPEGTRTRNGRVGNFKRGAFFMARDLHLPFVPTSVDGPFQILPKGGWWIQPHRITLKFHEPIDTTDLTQDNMQEYIDRVRDIIVKDIEG